MHLKLVMKHQILEFYQDSSNDDLGLTLTVFDKVIYGKMLIPKILWKDLKILA